MGGLERNMGEVVLKQYISLQKLLLSLGTSSCCHQLFTGAFWICSPFSSVTMMGQWLACLCFTLSLIMSFILHFLIFCMRILQFFVSCHALMMPLSFVLAAWSKRSHQHHYQKFLTTVDNGSDLWESFCVTSLQPTSLHFHAACLCISLSTF